MNKEHVLSEFFFNDALDGAWKIAIGMANVLADSLNEVERLRILVNENCPQELITAREEAARQRAAVDKLSNEYEELQKFFAETSADNITLLDELEEQKVTIISLTQRENQTMQRFVAAAEEWQKMLYRMRDITALSVKVASAVIADAKVSEIADAVELLKLCEDTV